MKFKKIADYAWLARGRKHWTLRIGNPFCVTSYYVSLTKTEEEIRNDVNESQRRQKQLFAKHHPLIPWSPEAKEE